MAKKGQAVEEIAEDEGGSLLSAKEAATQLGTDARTLRKFLRSQHGLVGQGQRWAIEPEAIPEMKEKFSSWLKPKAPDKKKGSVLESPEPDDELEEITDDDLDDLDDLEELEDLEV